ncbi:MAG: decaprenyl-phosphate phosphoribosyltransferase [Anaerolineales bacterium]|nr:decaprenyl-phosphate phosphoribosyltransferase [Anaerolineales bacterium]
MSVRMLKALFKSMRPRQWLKNGFLFAAPFFDRQLLDPVVLGRTLAGFVLFSLLSSVVYLINDLSDLEADRQHPVKCRRPLAAGELPVRTAQAAVVGLLMVILPLSVWLSPVFAGVGAGYFLLNLLYSRWLKHIVLLDVLVLAAFYLIRVGAGVALIHVSAFSPWLYVFTTFLALFVGVGKRRAELNLLAEGANAHRKVLAGYTLPLLDQLIIIVSTLTIATYSLYTFSASNLPANHGMMLTIPFVLYGIFRYLYLVQVEHSGGAPEEVLLTDRPMQLTLVLWGLAVLLIFYLLY